MFWAGGGHQSAVSECSEYSTLTGALSVCPSLPLPHRPCYLLLLLLLHAASISNPSPVLHIHPYIRYTHNCGHLSHQYDLDSCLLFHLLLHLVLLFFWLDHICSVSPSLSFFSFSLFNRTCSWLSEGKLSSPPCPCPLQLHYTLNT